MIVFRGPLVLFATLYLLANLAVKHCRGEPNTHFWQKWCETKGFREFSYVSNTPAPGTLKIDEMLKMLKG